MCRRCALVVAPSASAVAAAFAADSKTSLKVLLDDEVVVESWTGEEGSTALQEIVGLEGYSVQELTFEAIMDEGEWIAITEVRKLKCM